MFVMWFEMNGVKFGVGFWVKYGLKLMCMIGVLNELILSEDAFAAR